MKNLHWILCIVAAAFALTVFTSPQAYTTHDEPPPADEVQAISTQAYDLALQFPLAPSEAPPAAEALLPWRAPADLVNYVEDAMLHFADPKKQAGPATHHRAIAQDIADTTSWPGEPRVWADDTHGAKAAIVLASIGFWESRYRDYVDDGLCNDLTWRATPEGKKLLLLGDCDGGRAVGVVQVQFPSTGILLRGDGGWHDALYDRDDDNERATIFKADALADRKVLLLVALAMVRQSIKAGAGLANYCGGPHAVVKGRERLGTALDWIRRHPYTPAQ